jgi:SAM-dependent methyltransferase
MISIKKYISSLNRNATLLDIGCWNCSSLEEIKKIRKDIIITGIDIEKPKTESIKLLEKFIQLDLNKDILPFEKESFDFIRIVHLIEHLTNPYLLLNQLKSLLKPNGIIYIVTPNERSIFIPSLNFANYQHGPFNFYDDPTHLKPITTHGIYCLLEKAGFKNSEITVGINRTISQAIKAWPKFIMSVLTGNRRKMVTTLWTIVGWTSYGIGKKIE